MTTPLIPGQALFGPLIFGTPITTATQDRPYTGFTVTAIGGMHPLSFAVASGDLPPGVSINASTGVVSGTPTAADVYAAIILSVTGANGVSADLDAFTITVAEPVQIAGTPVTTATEGEPYDGFTVTGSEGTAPLVYAVHTGVFPDGIDIDPDTGEVSGTPTESGAFVGIVLDVTDTYGSTADLPSFDLTVSPPPPPPPGYTCGGVVFDGATSLINAMLACTENGKISFAGWVWYPDWSFPIVYCSDPDDNDANNVEGTGTQGVFNFNTYSGDGSTSIRLNNTSIPLTLSGWHWVAGSADISGAPAAHLFIDSVESSDVIASSGTGGTLGINGLPFGVGYDFGAFTDGYMADLWIAPGQLLDFSDPAVVAKFYSAGKPVSLGADGSTPTGTAPAIFLSIPHGGTPANFATNKGTGGNFTVTGALTLAPSSPSD